MLRKWVCVLLLVVCFAGRAQAAEPLKWVDFNVPVEALETAMKLDLASQGKEVELDWVEILAYGATKNGSGKLSPAQVRAAAEALSTGESPETLLGEQKKW